MAQIRRYPLVHHLRSDATAHVLHLSGGRVRHRGVGTAFWFRPLSATLSEVPVDDRELPLTLNTRTADYQEVTVIGTVAFRFGDPDLAASRVDFSIDPATGAWQGTPLEQVATSLIKTAAGQANSLLATLALGRALRTGAEELRAAMFDGLRADARVAAIGVEILDVRVTALRPDPDLERALQTPAREQAQQEADKATFERRAVAVEREAAIGENELTNKIALARRQQELVAQEGANARRRAEETAAAQAIESDGDARVMERMARAEAERERMIGESAAAAQQAMMDVYRDMPEQVLVALALRTAAENLPNVDSLTITSDLLSTLAGRLVSSPRTNASAGRS